MNLEGKQQIWNDYQKEIADDRYYYARSCIRQTFFPGSEWAYLDILNNKLGKTVLDRSATHDLHRYRLSFRCRTDRDYHDRRRPSFCFDD